MLKLELMMKRKDLIIDSEVVFALFTICHCADVMIDEIAECDLPESIRDGYRAVRSSISSLMEILEQYRDENIDTLLSDCED